MVVGGLGKNDEFDVSNWSLRTRHSRLGLKVCSRPCLTRLSPRTSKKGAKVTFHLLDHALMHEGQRCVRLRCSSLFTGVQVFAHLIDRLRLNVYQCPVCHTAMACLHVKRTLPIVLLHVLSQPCTVWRTLRDFWNAWVAPRDPSQTLSKITSTTWPPSWHLLRSPMFFQRCE